MDYNLQGLIEIEHKELAMILAGDIGGTKTNIGLYTWKEHALELHRKEQFSSRDYNSLEEILTAFNQKVTLSHIDAACFGIAGPVIEESCTTTNLPWRVSTLDLQAYLGLQNVRLLNDLEATAYGMLYLHDNAFIHLNPTAKKTKGNHAVIAAGTGLGEAMLYFNGHTYQPIGTEGGHSDFAPLSPQQDALLQWLRHRYPEHVSYERVLSGSGIYTIYQFLAQSGYAPEPASMLHITDDKDPNAMVSECALKEQDPLCIETLRLFCQIYGAEAGNLALKTMSLGGVYIGGGIAPKILSVLADGHFMKGFLSKGRFNKMLSQMEVKLSLNPETALLGAANYARDKF
ncbi:MAG: Glucokinase (EC [uncultured Sulfurovum sp.]|uniref:Glucokinase n=1 Tax=uncultured Sulfurovum sp. TaxID=269237 RepID=A0A6S6TS62_9BACT|nr:MAG: Glucokinase (EC [uncultured Sulfurovum sp.]